jgi:hypothetical protein
MDINKNVLTSIIAKHNISCDSDSIKILVDEVKRIEDINAKKRQLVKQIYELDAKYTANLQQLKESLETLRRSCLHEDTTYHVGTGNNDSYSTCNICGGDV